MDIRQIRYFMVVAEKKNISAAAKILHISQPPLSRQIKALEDELGLALFIRDNNGLSLTPAGLFFLEKAKALILQFENIVEEMKVFSKQHKKQIHLGSIDSTSVLVEPIYKKLFEQACAEEQITSHEGTADEITAKLLNKEVDIAFVRYPFANMELFDEIILYEERWCAFVDKENFPSLYMQDSVSITELNQHKLILPSRQSLYLPILNAITTAKCKPTIIGYYFALATGPYLAKKAKSITIIPKSITELMDIDAQSIKPIIEPMPSTGYIAIKLKEAFNSETVSKLWNLTRNFNFDLTAT